MTQLLWKSSTKMGVGVSKSPNGMYYLVANYDPRGNVMDSFKINLPDIKQEDIEEANESQKSKDNWNMNKEQIGLRVQHFQYNQNGTIIRIIIGISVRVSITDTLKNSWEYIYK